MSAGEMFGSSASYDRLMGRYTVMLSSELADRAEIGPGQRILDVGCGTGALTVELVRRVGADRVWGLDPSPAHVDACQAQLPGVHVELGAAEALPYDDEAFDATLSQLVVHFFADADRAMQEMRRVTRAGGVVGAVGWDVEDGMTLLREVHAAAAETDPDRDRARSLRVGRTRREELADLFDRAGLDGVSVEPVDLVGHYEGHDDLVGSLRSGVGPIGIYVGGLGADEQRRLFDALLARLGVPDEPFDLPARAWCALGRVPV
jgi:SAM-dependent methyltransferase